MGVFIAIEALKKGALGIAEPKAIPTKTKMSFKNEVSGKYEMKADHCMAR